MPRLRHLLLLSILAMGLVPRGARAGAWVQAPGQSFLKASLLSQRADQRWGCRGGTDAADPDGEFLSRQLFLYGEVGWLQNLTVLGSWAYKDQSVEADPGYGTRSTGDLRLGTRYGVRQGPRALAVETHLSIPTYPASDLSQPPGVRRQFLPAGSGKVEAEVHVLAGASLYPLPLYTNLDLGYRARGGRFGDQWLSTLEVGASGPWVFAKAELRAAFPDHETCQDTGSVGAVAFTERTLQLSPEVAVRLSEAFWLSLGVSAPLSGRNSLKAPVWSLGILRWKPSS